MADSILPPVLVGALLGGLFVRIARRRGGEAELRFLAVGLLAAAVIYIAFAAARADGRWVALESAGLLLYGPLAWLGRRRPGLLALGWAAHVGWDVALHLDTAQPVVGSWYPLGCIGFDLIVAGYLLRIRGTTTAPAVTALVLVSACGASRPGTPVGSVPVVTDLAGSRERPGLFTQRLLLPADYCGPVHTHDHDLHGLVLRGALRMGFVDSTGRVDVREYPAGSFVVVPAGRRHVEGSGTETEIHLSGIGPLRTALMDSATPERCVPGGS
jgi:quercetin dioxygenase-like cupin family protein